MAVSEPIIAQNYSIPNVGGTTVALNNVGTVGAQVIAADPQRKKISFINPNMVGNVNLLVFQMTGANGNSLAGVTFASPGGGTPVLPGGMVQFEGDVQGAWGAVAQSGMTNGITVIPSRS